MSRVLGAGTVSVTIMDYQHIPCLTDIYSMISQCEDEQSIIVLHKLDWHCIAMPVDMIYQHCSLFINLKPVLFGFIWLAHLYATNWSTVRLIVIVCMMITRWHNTYMIYFRYILLLLLCLLQAYLYVFLICNELNNILQKCEWCRWTYFNWLFSESVDIVANCVIVGIIVID